MKMTREEFEEGADWLATDLFNAFSESIDGAAEELIEKKTKSPIEIMDSSAFLYTEIAGMLSTYRDEYLGVKYYTHGIEEKLDNFEEYCAGLVDEFDRTKDEKEFRNFAFAVCDVLAVMLNAIGYDFQKDFGTFKEAYEFKKLVFTNLIDKFCERYGNIKIEGGRDHEEENH